MRFTLFKKHFVYRAAKMAKKCFLFRDEHIPLKASFPVIDAHNHLFGKWDFKKISNVMDEVGVISFCDLSANTKITFAKGGFIIKQGDIKDFFVKQLRGEGE